MSASVVQMLTLDEVADALRCHRRTVERLVSDGRLRHVKVGRRTLVTSRELAAYAAREEKRSRTVA